MNDEPEATTPTSPLDEPQQFLIHGIDFGEWGYPREFTLKELNTYREIAKQHDLDGIRADWSALVSEFSAGSVDSRFRTQEKRVQAVEQHLDKLLTEMAEDPDAWDEERLRAVEERLVIEADKLKAMAPEQAQDIAQRAPATEERGNEIQARRDAVHLRIAHALAKLHGAKPGSVDEWLEEPTVETLDNAATLVEVGETSTPLNREQRRQMARTGRFASSGSGRSRPARR